jgi:hypothetical protein
LKNSLRRTSGILAKKRIPTALRESSIFDDFRNFSKKQGLTIFLPKQNPERAEGERIILRFAEARGFLR